MSGMSDGRRASMWADSRLLAGTLLLVSIAGAAIVVDSVAEIRRRLDETPFAD